MPPPFFDVCDRLVSGFCFGTWATKQKNKKELHHPSFFPSNCTTKGAFSIFPLIDLHSIIYFFSGKISSKLALSIDECAQ